MDRQDRVADYMTENGQFKGQHGKNDSEEAVEAPDAERAGGRADRVQTDPLPDPDFFAD
ncbi:MAG: hypothetical protein HY545_00315 [Candidatus Doudnabacteria bacterium]|nr:hypothetical protein [Candidatus Doudnabacteria bacterium]